MCASNISNDIQTVRIAVLGPEHPWHEANTAFECRVVSAAAICIQLPAHAAADIHSCQKRCVSAYAHFKHFEPRGDLWFSNCLGPCLSDS